MEFTLHNYKIEPEKYNLAQDTFFSPLSKEMFESQFVEVFQDEHYKPGKYKEDMVVVDIGANMGLTLHYFAPNARIMYGLEPSQMHYTALEKNTANLPNAKIFQLAIGAETGQDILSTNEQGHVPESIYGDGQISESVPSMRLDEFFTREGINHVDLLKIDCEGAEYEILLSQGFANVADSIDRIIGEAHFLGNCDPRFIPEILKEFGFTTEWLPIKNMFRNMSGADRNKSYKLEFETLFLATKDA